VTMLTGLLIGLAFGVAYFVVTWIKDTFVEWRWNRRMRNHRWLR
jgi:hypothetical protein